MRNNHGEMAKLWLEWNSTTTQEARNRNAKNSDEKYDDRLEMFVHNEHVRVVTWRVAA
jgi:hypothetical protein